ncbi:MAG: protein-L-isoaspartate(D-aspartate) O-methyltransferase [Alphaproteobacteria bacterium]|nr:protein-L-isoaspartate(D-aspartate) O-methyltransferase [Alphaproteobacteria bacterium]
MRRNYFRANNLVALLFLLAIALAADATDYYLQYRKALALHIDERAFTIERETGVTVLDRRVLAAITHVPRHHFVPVHLKTFAYSDVPLPLGHGQNIATPFLIALMTDLARIGENDVVFETGTGAGYHAAILAELGRQVYSVEVVAPLAGKASAVLRKLGYGNVETRIADGYFGWEERGPFDAIIVKEAVDHVPVPLLNQLKPGGRMVIPVGPADGFQELFVIEKDLQGVLRKRSVLPVRFSPLQGGSRI